MTTYLGELRDNWRPLLAATFGMGTGYAALALYTPSVIAPHLIAEFGWSKSAFAALGSISLAVALCIPFAGRLADVIGVKLAALIGMITLPVSFVAYSLMTGPMWQYVAIYLFQSIFCITMTSTVYSRVAVQYIEKARGLALAIVAIGPTITGVAAGPVLNAYIENNGWRATYHLLTVFSVVCAVITFFLLPPERRAGEAPPPRRRAREDYPEILRSRLFWILVASMLLCNLSQVLALSQLSRAVEQREDKRPQLSDLRESGSIEQDADVVMFIYRAEYYLERMRPEEDGEKMMKWQEKRDRAHNIAECIISKQRHGPIGIVPMCFEPEKTRFSDLDFEAIQRYGA